ncbi:MAG: hypothetical protein KBS94_03875 [Prevotella sp.]|nr:hypothetical protein [Candidatus Equicola faecalis]MDO4819122.1 hypothetical protein [Prevotella sp.]
MAFSKEEWSAKLRNSLEIKRKAQAESRALLSRLQVELDTKGFYTL